MKLIWRALLLLTVLLVPAARAVVLVGVEPLELTVDGIQRTALVYVPPLTAGKTVPLVFVFHGHGGKSAQAIGVFGINRRWPEAISVYPQGLNIPSITDPEGVRAGWQHTVGEAADRDLHFFDALLVRLKKDYPVDPKEVYATGHSNGGGFTYLLWKARPEVFAAVAPCSSAVKFSPELTPKPALICGGKEDPIVRFESQEREVDALQKVNGCDPHGVPWAEGKGTLYPSQGGTPLVTFFYEGGHAMAPGESDLIVKFFQEHSGGGPRIGP
jgi:polyhydroxybutyrate depolymerase